MPTPLTFDLPDYQTNETLKAFDSTDALAKSYLDLDSRVKSGSIDLLPEEIRKDNTISKYKTIPELAKGYVEAQKMISGIKKAPEKIEDYKFTPLSDLHPKLQTEGIQGALKGIFHKAGIDNDRGDVVQQQVLSMLSGSMAQQDKARTELAQKNETALRQEWGGDYDKKMDQVINVLNRAGGVDPADVDNVAKAMKGSPSMLKALGKIVGLLSEDTIGSLGEAGDKPITDAKTAQTEIQKYNQEILSDPKHPYNDERNPKHGDAKKKMDDLFKVAYPQ